MVAEIDVVKPQLTDGLETRGVDRGHSQDEASDRSGRGVHGLLAVHPGQEQLLVGQAAQERRQDGDLVLGFETGLQPAQAAVPLLDRSEASAERALTDLVKLAEGVAGPAVAPRAKAEGKTERLTVEEFIERTGLPDEIKQELRAVLDTR